MINGTRTALDTENADDEGEWTRRRQARDSYIATELAVKAHPEQSYRHSFGTKLRIVADDQGDEHEAGLIDYGAGPDHPPGPGNRPKNRYIKWERVNTGKGASYRGYDDGLPSGGPTLFRVKKAADGMWELKPEDGITGIWGWPHHYEYISDTASDCKWIAEMYWRPDPDATSDPYGGWTDDQRQLAIDFARTHSIPLDDVYRLMAKFDLMYSD